MLPKVFLRLIVLSMKKVKGKFITVATRYGSFECLFEPNVPEKGYTVTVPKLRGIVTCGDTLQEAKKMAKEAIELHCECLLHEGLAELKINQRLVRKNYVPA